MARLNIVWSNWAREECHYPGFEECTTVPEAAFYKFGFAMATLAHCDKSMARAPDGTEDRLWYRAWFVFAGLLTVEEVGDEPDLHWCIDRFKWMIETRKRELGVVE